MNNIKYSKILFNLLNKFKKVYCNKLKNVLTQNYNNDKITNNMRLFMKVIKTKLFKIYEKVIVLC